GGFDDMPDTLAAIRQGTVQFCLAQRTYRMGWLSLVKLMEAVEGKPIEKEIDTGIVVVTLDNVDTYMDEMKAESR
ncbi:MAG: sugar-binding protein, partial [Planctomycetota bacterium]